LLGAPSFFVPYTPFREEARALLSLLYCTLNVAVLLETAKLLAAAVFLPPEPPELKLAWATTE